MIIGCSCWTVTCLCQHQSVFEKKSRNLYVISAVVWGQQIVELTTSTPAPKYYFRFILLVGYTLFLSGYTCSVFWFLLRPLEPWGFSNRSLKNRCCPDSRLHKKEQVFLVEYIFWPFSSLFHLNGLRVSVYKVLMYKLAYHFRSREGL